MLNAKNKCLNIKMNDPKSRIRELEARHRKLPNSPRSWAEAVLSGTRKIDEVPEHLVGIVQDHLDTHVLHAAGRILALPNGGARLAAFNALEERMRDPVRAAVHALKGKKK